jgi:hypothetical protein
MQNKVMTQSDVVNIAMSLESTSGGDKMYAGLAQVQSQPPNLGMYLQDMEKGKLVCMNVQYTMCRIEGHHVNECHALGNHMAMGTPNPFPTRPQT